MVLLWMTDFFRWQVFPWAIDYCKTNHPQLIFRFVI